MLTSYITVNTPRSISDVKHAGDADDADDADADFLTPMNDKKIFGNILDAMLGGTDSVRKIMYFLCLFFL